MLAILLALLLPLDHFTRDEVDLAEWNTVTTSDFQQVIFWGWNGERMAVRAWRSARHVSRPTRVNGQWVIRWHDPDGRPREVWARRVIETATDYDPEREDLQQTKHEERKGLR